MKLQPVFLVCQTAIEEWRRRTKFKSCRVQLENHKAKIWLDAALFERAIIDLLEVVTQKNGQHEEILFAITSERFNSCRISIGYTRKVEKPGQNKDNMNPRPGWETVEIVSQHRGKIETVEDKLRGGFLIHLPC